MSASASSGTLTGAIITASVAGAVAVLGYVFLVVRTRLDRRYERRRDALKDVQDAVLTLREALTRYGLVLSDAIRSVDGTVAVRVPAEVDVAVSSGRARLKMLLERLDEPRIDQTVRSWRRLAEDRFISTEDTTAAQEDVAFGLVVKLTGNALKSTRGRLRRGERQTG